MAIDYESLFLKENIDFDVFKKRYILSETFEASRGRKEVFEAHIEMLEKEFSQRTLLEFYCVWLIVKIRRKIDLESSVESFFLLWEHEKDFLTQHLSSRWLVSVCDTYIDYTNSKDELGYAFGSVLLMNTIKLYETEQKMYQWKIVPHDIVLVRPKIQLFDGMTAYSAKGGDMIANMMQRVEEKMSQEIVTASIYKELIQRCTKMDTVFSRMIKYKKILNLEGRID